MIVQTYYISTGAKNAMYTLRITRHATGTDGRYNPDHYICNLAIDEDKAIAKAKAYVDAIKERIPDTDTFHIVFDQYPHEEIYKRIGRLSVRDTHNLKVIETGIMPFGKHSGMKFEDCPDSYVLYFADKTIEDNGQIMNTIAGVFMGVALSKGLIAARDAKRLIIAAQNQMSEFIGTVGERLTLEGEIVYSFYKEQEWASSFWINKIRCGNNLVIYNGSKSLGSKDEKIKFKATVKKHELFQGTKTTKVNRPAVIKE